MKKVLVLSFLLSLTTSVYSQNRKRNQNKEIHFPMTSQYWEYKEGQAEFIMHRSVPAVRGVNGNAFQIFLKDYEFTNGTIEYDVELIGRGFPGINFRLSEDRKAAEHFYIRSFGEVTPLKRTTLQYATVSDGMSFWDLTDDYQGGATIYQEGWNHVKLVISGRQMRVYVNDMNKVALHVPILEGEMDKGGIALDGNVIYANMVIKPNATEGIPDEAGYDPTYSDPHYIRNWLVTQPVNFPFGRDMILNFPNMYGGTVKSDVPDSTALWTPIKARHRAVVNLSIPYGLTKQSERRLAWLKTTIKSESAQERRLDLGFSDEVWVFINGEIIHFDKNIYGTPSMKEPRGRCTLDNASIKLALKEGDNEILIGLTNYFYGWGIIARLDNTDGLTYDQ